MKKIILAIVLMSLAIVSCKKAKNKVEAGEEITEVKEIENVINSFKVNVEESSLTWKGSKPTGSHNGVVSLESGVFDIEDKLVKAGEFAIDMSTISCTDLEAGKGKEKLETHLKSADFFDVEKFPSAKFAVTNSEAKEGKIHLTGNLTIKDITKSITIAATLVEDSVFTTLKSDVFSIDRTDFGVTYNSKKFDAALKDKFINDFMEMSFEIKAKK
ncbi:MAG: YceI family protein [Tenacibaculum sp.]